jgi:hypothetical protein
VRSELNSCGGRVDQVMLTNQMDVLVVLVTGLLRSQLFAKKVNAMIEQWPRKRKVHRRQHLLCSATLQYES